MTNQEQHDDLVGRSVRDAMSRPVLSVTVDVVLSDVLAAMVRTGLRHLAVIDDGARCVGVVSDRAVAAAWAADPTALAYMPVGQVLERRPSVVGADATVGDVAQAMYVDGVDAVAVIDRAGTPIGMVTGGDLVALMATQVAELAPGHPVSSV
jgi:CBS domain-containing protein